MPKNHKSLRTFLSAAAVCALLAAACPAQADGGALRSIGAAMGLASPGQPLTSSDLVVDLAGIQSFDELGAPTNTVLTLNALPGGVVDAISLDVTISTHFGSWLSDTWIRIANSAGNEAFLAPADGSGFPGSGSYAGSGSLVASGLSFQVLADGVLTLEFFEIFDDLAGAADATFTSGTITFGGLGVSAVPEPGTYGLMALGLLAVAGAARRRKAD